MTLVKINDDEYQVQHTNGVRLGKMYKEIDGFFVFSPDPYLTGFYESAPLHWLADELDRLNKEWNDRLDTYFNELPSNPSPPR